MAQGRSIIIDIYAVDSEGKVYDIEIQRASKGADVHRARFHSSMIDTRMLKERRKFKELHDFRCTSSIDMFYPVLADQMRYFKETEGGRGQMCRILEEMRNEVAAQVTARVTAQVTERVTEQVTAQTTYDKAVKTALKLLAIGKLTQEEIADSTELSLTLVQ